MRIVVHLTQEATQQIRSPRSRSAKRDVLGWLDEALTPMHAKTSDPALASFFEVTIDDPAEAARLVQQLQTDPAVDGAYIKPDDELP